MFSLSNSMPFCIEMCQVHYFVIELKVKKLFSSYKKEAKEGARDNEIKNEKEESTEIACFLQFVSREETILHAISDIMSRSIDFTFIRLF